VKAAEENRVGNLTVQNVNVKFWPKINVQRQNSYGIISCFDPSAMKPARGVIPVGPFRSA
jgi:hypothetical protein